MKIVKAQWHLIQDIKISTDKRSKKNPEGPALSLQPLTFLFFMWVDRFDDVAVN